MICYISSAFFTYPRIQSMSKLFSKCIFSLLALLFFGVAQAQIKTVIDYHLADIAISTFVRSSNPNNYFGTNPYIVVGGRDDTSIGMFKMNMDLLPKLAVGDKVELYLYNVNFGGSSQPTQIKIGLAGVNWNENWSWKSSLLWYVNTVVIVNTSPYGDWTKIDITSSYNILKARTIPNNGWLLVPVSTNNNFNFFASMNNSNTTLHPFLRVTK